MRRTGLFALTLLPIVLAACGSEAISPTDGKLTVPPPGLVTTAGSCNAADITKDIAELMEALTPNNNAAQSKWEYVQTLMGYNHPDSTAKAREYADDVLLAFINLKYSQASAATQAAFAALLAQVTDAVHCFVSGFDIPTSNDPTVIALANGLGGVWFPPGFCDANCGGIDVTLEELPACIGPNDPIGCVSNPLGTLLDTYGNYLRITLTGGTPNVPPIDDPQDPFDLPIVALCVPAGTPLTIANGLLVGHQDDGSSVPAGFSVLDPALIPGELAALLICPDIGALNDGPASAPKSMLARLVNRVADLLLPKKAAATRVFLGGLGIGGTSRTFSPFGLINTTLGATGGLGGSKTTFSPSLTTLPDGNLQDSINVIQTENLPGVYVKTKNGTAIPGVEVTFTVQNPITVPYQATPSNAKVCDVTGEFVTETNDDGFAQLDCLNFGDKLGYKDLAATADPSTAPGLADAGGIDNITVAACNAGTCDPSEATATLHWLVTTVTGPAAKLTLPTPPGTTSAKLGEELALQPVAKVTDASDNPISGAGVTVALTVGDGTLGCLGGGGACMSATTIGDGTATFDNLIITGTVAGVEQTLTFTSGTLTETATVTPTAGDAKKLAVVTAPVAGQLGKAFTTQPEAKVTDEWDNPISGATVDVDLTAGAGTLGCFSGSGCTTSPATVAGGTTTFTNLMITGTGANAAQTLTFSATGTTDQTATVTPTVDDAKILAVVTPPVAGQLGQALTTQPQVKVTDEWDNAISGATVTVALTAGGGTLGCFTGSGCATAPTTIGDGTTTFANLMITGLVAGVAQTLTFKSTGTTDQTRTVTPTAGPATQITANNPAGGTYPVAVAPFTTASPPPRVKVTDDYGNPVSAGILWELASPLTGASLSATASTSDAVTGLSSVGWTLGDGGNGLKAYLGTTAGPFAAFSAATTSGVLEACTTSGSTKKADLGTYSSTLGGYTGWFSIKSAKLGLIRTVAVNLSVTGQSSGTGNYVTTLRAFRNNGGVKGDLVAEGKPNTSDQTLKLPGSNSSPTPILFTMVPSTPVPVGELIIFELEIKAASTRKFQVWYNTKTTAATPCYDSKLYAPALATPNFNTTTQFLRGLHLNVTN